MKRFRFLLNSLGILFILYLIFPYKSFDKQVTSYYNEFMSYVYSSCELNEYHHPSQIVIGFTTLLPKSTVGICFRGPISYRIYLLKDYWDKSNDIVRYGLIMHELSHCVLYMTHSDDPTNYMYPYTSGFSSVQKIREQLLLNISEICTK